MGSRKTKPWFETGSFSPIPVVQKGSVAGVELLISQEECSVNRARAHTHVYAGLKNKKSINLSRDK